MMDNIIQLAAAGVGTLGFSLIFRIRKKLLPFVVLGGILNWGVYLLMVYYGGNEFFSCFIASAFAGVYSECMARLIKAPTILFVISALIPSIPGGSLYYTMSAAVSNDWAGMRAYGYKTLQTALGIAAGISVVWAVMIIFRRIHGQKA